MAGGTQDSAETGQHEEDQGRRDGTGQNVRWWRVTPVTATGDDGDMSASQQPGGDPARDAGQPRPVITSGLPSQLIDTDPDETQEWVDSLDAVIDHAGRERARYLMLRMLERSREQQVGVPSLRSTDYINTIAPEREPYFPGDEHVERRIRAYIRWNAAIMVHRAQRPGKIGRASCRERV